MKSVKIRTKFDYRAMKYLNLYLLKYKRKTYLLYSILIVLAIAFGIYLFISSKGKGYLWPIVFALVVVYTTVQAFSIEKNLDKQLERFFNGKAVIEQIIDLSQEKLTIAVSTRPNEPVDYDWAYVSEIVELPQFYFLFVNGNNPIILDKSPEAFVEGSLEDLVQIIEEKIQTKPFKKIEKDIAKRPITYVHQEVEEVHKDETLDAVEVESEVVSEKESEETSVSEENKEEVSEKENTSEENTSKEE